MRPRPRLYELCASIALVFSAGAVLVEPRSRRDDEPRPRTSLERAAPPGAANDAPGKTDADGDGIDDATELSLAKSYFPYFSLDPNDGCSRHGVLFRLAPHPHDASKMAIWYVVLFERDCGIRGIGAHIGDDEVFGEMIDPKVPAPSGILALRSISHQNTSCERVTSCGSLASCLPCATAIKSGRPYPVVFSSFNKHGNYVTESVCDRWPCDLRGCTLNRVPDVPPFVNAGEPGKPLCTNLTTGGFVNSEQGWTEPSLLNFNPWNDQKFGRAGSVTSDLSDPSFLIDPAGCEEPTASRHSGTLAETVSRLFSR